MIELVFDHELTPAEVATLEAEHGTALRYKSGKYAGELKVTRADMPDYTKPKSRMVDVLWEFPGYTQPMPEWASSTPGLYSVAADVITSLTENTDIPFLKALGRVVSISKDLGTYFISEDGEKGMLTLVGEDNIVHHQLNHTSTVTGRLSSSNPNSQNLPKGNKSKVKQVFTSRYPGGYICASDFSALEVYCQAWQTGAKNLIQDLKDGLDMHCVKLSAKEHMPYEEVLKLAKGYTNEAGEYVPADPEWDMKRTHAKVYSFQSAYGAGVATIAKSTGLTVEEVQALADADAERYPEIASYFEDLEQEIERNAAPTSTFVAHPLNPAVRVQLRVSRVRSPDGKLYTFRSHPSMGFMLKRGVTNSFSPTERKNYLTQGLGAQVMKAALVLVVREMARRNNFDGKAKLITTIHDACYIDAHPDVAHEAAALMHACLTQASAYFEYVTGWKVPLPVPTDTTWGANMSIEDKPDHPDYPALCQAMQDTIAVRYFPDYQPSWTL